MSKQREAFEAHWAQGLGKVLELTGDEEADATCRIAKIAAQQAWQASRAAALEEARLAVEAEELSGESNDPSDRAYDCAVEDCIAAVNALKEQS